MTTLQIQTDDKSIIEQIKQLLATRTSSSHIKIIEDTNTSKTQEKSKWAKMAEEMRGSLTKEDAQYLQECSREIRDGFELREYK